MIIVLYTELFVCNMLLKQIKKVTLRGHLFPVIQNEITADRLDYIFQVIISHLPILLFYRSRFLNNFPALYQSPVQVLLFPYQLSLLRRLLMM